MSVINEIINEIVNRLYPYQKDCVGLMRGATEIYQPGENLKDRCFLCALPTGMGKTYTFTSFLALYFALTQNKNCLIFAHKEELCEQIVDSLIDFGFPKSKIDLLIRSKPKKRRITVATIQSLTSSQRLHKIPTPDVIIIDECHRSAARTYQEVIKQFTNSIVFGFTATPLRVLPEFKKIFAETWTILYNEYTLIRAIEEAYLCNLKYFRINLQKLGIKPEEETRYNIGLINEEIVRKYKEVGGGKFLVFANSVDHSKSLQHTFSTHGFTCYHVDGTTKKKDRKRILEEFKQYDMNDDCIITNYNVYTEGVDVKNLRGVIIACKLSAKSIVKFLQMIGRVTRLFPGKEFGIVLEVRNNRNKALVAALNKIFRLFYQDVDEYDDYEEDDILNDEMFDIEEGEQQLDDCATVEDVELELQSFFSPLPQTLIKSKLSWQSTVQGVFFCHINKEKYFEIIERNDKTYDVYGINSVKRKHLFHAANLQDAEKTCCEYAEKYYVEFNRNWNKEVQKHWENVPATDAQKKKLKRSGYNIEGLTKAQANKIISMVYERKRHEPISKKQQQFLWVKGFRGDKRLVNKANVGAIIKNLERSL